MHRTQSSRSAPVRPGSIVVSVAALLALGAHLMLTLVYLSPPNIAQERLGELARSYMVPLFRQNWHLFSPNPGISTRKLAIRCQGEGEEWGEWFDPLEGLVQEHYADRLSGVGKLLYVYRAIGDDLRVELAERTAACRLRVVRAATAAGPGKAEPPDPSACSSAALMDEMVRTREFALASRYASLVCEESADSGPATVERVQFKLLEFFPVKYADREEADASGRRWGEVREDFFPILEGE